MIVKVMTIWECEVGDIWVRRAQLAQELTFEASLPQNLILTPYPAPTRIIQLFFSLLGAWVL